MVSRVLILLYGVIAYIVFLASFIYAIGFLANFLVPKGIDDGAAAPLWQAILINVLLLGAFAVQHTIMARPGFKAWWTKFVPVAMERSTFVLLASLLLGLMYWQWRPMTGTIWSVEQPALRAVLFGIYGLGWLLVLYSTFLINHFDLFGLRQVVINAQGRAYSHVPFIERSLYKWIRNPLMAGFIVAFWATPDMTAGHLLFAIVTTVYILVAIRCFEEPDIARFLGEKYEEYRRRTPMLIPFTKRR